MTQAASCLMLSPSFNNHGNTPSVMPRRVALVVGNGTYAANPLKNPPNDAADVAAALKDAGFEVTLL